MARCTKVALSETSPIHSGVVAGKKSNEIMYIGFCDEVQNFENV